jgi:hypothetical protein
MKAEDTYAGVTGIGGGGGGSSGQTGLSTLASRRRNLQAPGNHRSVGSPGPARVTVKRGRLRMFARAALRRRPRFPAILVNVIDC